MSPSGFGSFYGYKDNADRFTQLQEVLGLKFKPVQFQALQNELILLTDKYIDRQGYKAQYQKKALENIDKELWTRYPEIFRGQNFLKKLYYARRTIIHIDQRRRLELVAITAPADHENGILKKEQPKTSLGFVDLTIDSDDEVLLAYQETSSDGQAAKYAKATQINGRSSSKRRLEYIQAEHPKKMAKIESFFSKQDSENTRVTKIKEEQIDMNSPRAESEISFLRQFLSKCNPSMDHLHHKFVEFGCSTEAHLKSLSREWSEEQRRDLLRKIILGSKILENGRLLMEMDVEVVDYYLGADFL